MTEQLKTTLLVIRHGETVWNRELRFQGYGDSPLTGAGRAQARALGRRLRGVDFEALICSDLGRTKATAAFIAESTGHAVETDHRLRERNFGVLEGLRISEIKHRHPSVLDRLNAFDPEYVIPAGESHRQHYQRNVNIIEELLAEKTGATVALVAHSGFLDSIFRHVARLELQQPRCFSAANASLSIFSHGLFYGARRWVIETLGDVGHLIGIKK